MKATEYTVKDLEYARNRHPYWKKVKQKGSVERNQLRREKYNFYDRKKYGSKKLWTDEDLKEFLRLNDEKKDWELAKHFERSIPSIQFIRRKIQLALKIAKLDNKKVDKYFLLKMIVGDDNILRQQYFDLAKKRRRA